MPDLEILGQDTGIERSKLPMIVALGGLAIGLLIFRRRGASSAPGGGSSFDSGAALEFARVSGAADQDMRQLTATNNLRRYELDLAQQNTPAGLRTTLTGEQYRALPRGVRKQLSQQVARGGLIISPGEGGTITYTPTETGQIGTRRPLPGPRRPAWWERLLGAAERTAPYWT